MKDKIFRICQEKRVRVGTFEVVEVTTVNVDNLEAPSDNWKLHRGVIDKKMKPSALFKFSSAVTPPSDCIGVVAFDMDSTLITTKSGATFSENVDDWKLLYPNVSSKIREMHEQGYHIAIISNQNGLSKGHVTLESCRNSILKVYTS